MELLERESDLELLENHLRQAVAGRGRVVFLAGEAGVGKTALVDEFSRRIADQIDVLRISCDALSTPGPLGPVRDIAAALGLPIDQHSLHSDAREQLFRAILAALAARPGPTVLIGEDAHWADGASLEILRFLGRRIGVLPFLDVVTYRDDELGPDHPLRIILGDLATAPAVHRMRVRPLSEEAVRRLAEGSERDATALHRLTGGNPFFVTEVLASDDMTVPATVGDAVLARAARLAPEVRAVLDVVAVIGATIDPNLLQRIAGPVLDEVDEGIARGLLQGTGGGLAFRHELAREAILAAITPPRRRLLHARVLAALREEAAGERKLALLAHHAEAAGDGAAVLTFAVAAAEQASVAHAFREAAAQYARALRFAGDVADAERVRMLEAHAAACYLGGQWHEAIDARLAALQIRRCLGDRPAEGVNLCWLSRNYWYEGRNSEAEETAAAALEVLQTVPPGPPLAMAFANLARLRMLASDRGAALTWGERAINLAERLGDRETLVHALATVGTAHLDGGDDQGRAMLERSLHLALEDNFVDQASRAMTNLARCALAWLQLDEADRHLDMAVAFATEHDLNNDLHYLKALKAVVLCYRGAWDEALAELSALFQQPALKPLTRIVALTAFGRIQGRRGEPSDEALDEALPLAERTGELLRLGPVRAARAEAALLAGDCQRALAEAQAIRELAFERGNPWMKGEIAWLLWRAGDHDLPDDGLAPPYAMQLAGEWAAAAAAWEALGCPYDAAGARLESDDPDAIRRAIATFEQLQARPALALAMHRLRALGVRELPVIRRGPRPATRANPAGLTPREAEVLALLAQGLRNAEIAARLYLAPKTVRHHVSAILAKLGVATRAEAAHVAAQRGIIPS